MLPILSLVAFVSVTQGQPVTKSIQLREIYRIGEKKNEEFVQAGEITADSKGSIFVTDRFQYTVRKFDSKGVLLKEFGKRGKNTGEFRSTPYKIDCRLDTIATVDAGTQRVQFFSSDLQALGEMNTAGAIADLAYDNNGHIFASVIPFSGKREDILMLYDKSGKIISKVPLDDVTGQPAFDMILICVDAQNRLIAAYQSINKVVIYNERNEPVHQFGVAGLPRQVGQNTAYLEKLGTLPEGKLFLDIGTDTAGRIFILGGDYSHHPNQDVYVFDREGNFLLTFTLPDQSGILYLDRHKFLYTREQHRRIMKKYTIDYINF